LIETAEANFMRMQAQSRGIHEAVSMSGTHVEFTKRCCSTCGSSDIRLFGQISPTAQVACAVCETVLGNWPDFVTSARADAPVNPGGKRGPKIRKRSVTVDVWGRLRAR
jgi:hypothetical protein